MRVLEVAVRAASSERWSLVVGSGTPDGWKKILFLRPSACSLMLCRIYFQCCTWDVKNLYLPVSFVKVMLGHFLQ